MGALIDEKLNSLQTKYSNDDLGLKRANEAMLFNIAGDAILGGDAYAIKKGYNAFTNIANIKPSGANLAQNASKNIQKLASGNINAVENFLAKSALSPEEREAIKKNAEAMFLNGKSLNEFKA